MEDSAENARVLGSHDAGLKAITFNSSNGTVLTGEYVSVCLSVHPRVRLNERLR